MYIPYIIPFYTCLCFWMFCFILTWVVITLYLCYRTVKIPATSTIVWTRTVLFTSFRRTQHHASFQSVFKTNRMDKVYTILHFIIWENKNARGIVKVLKLSFYKTSHWEGTFDFLLPGGLISDIIPLREVLYGWSGQPY